jgi:transposase
MGMEGDTAMPWKEMDAMSLRKEFVLLAKQTGSNIQELCRRYQISLRTDYKWLMRFEQEGELGLVDHSRRPKHIHKQTNAKMQTMVLEVREQTGWGGRKIARGLQDQGYINVPHPNTITDILHRAGKLDEEECANATSRLCLKPFRPCEPSAFPSIWDRFGQRQRIHQ